MFVVVDIGSENWTGVSEEHACLSYRPHCAHTHVVESLMVVLGPAASHIEQTSNEKKDNWAASTAEP